MWACKTLLSCKCNKLCQLLCSHANSATPTAAEFEEVLKSLAWQSPSLSQYFAHQNMRFRLMAGGHFERENELLSEGDIADLLEGA